MHALLLNVMRDACGGWISNWTIKFANRRRRHRKRKCADVTAFDEAKCRQKGIILRGGHFYNDA